MHLLRNVIRQLKLAAFFSSFVFGHRRSRCLKQSDAEAAERETSIDIRRSDAWGKPFRLCHHCLGTGVEENWAVYQQYSVKSGASSVGNTGKACMNPCPVCNGTGRIALGTSK